MSYFFRCSVCVLACLWSSVLPANQSLTTPGAVLDALNHRTGNVVIAWIDPGPVSARAIFSRLSQAITGLDASLNGQSIGSLRPNTLRYVQPRLGLNRLRLEDSDEGVMQGQFGAMRSAGVSTGIVVVQPLSDGRLQIASLSAASVDRIRVALERSLAGGMPRVIRLIQNRGIEALPVLPESRKNWSAGRRVGSDNDGSDGGGANTSATSSSQSTPEIEADVDESVAESPDTEVTGEVTDNAGEDNAQSAESSDFDVSADRRSFY